MTRRSRSGRRAGKKITTVTVFDPLSVATMLAWYDVSDATTLFKDTAGTDPVTANDDVVARMNDKSGNGYSMTQTTSGNRPLYKTSGLNSRKALVFDGTNDFMVTANVTKGAFTVFIVCEQASATGYVFEHSSSASAESYLYKPNGSTAHVHRGTAGNAINHALFTSGAHVYIQRYNPTGTTQHIYRDTTTALATSTTNPGTNNITAPLALAAHNSGSSVGNLKFQEVMLYSTSVSDGDLATVLTYLKDKWGIA